MLFIGFLLGCLLVPLIARAVTVKEPSHNPHPARTYGIALVAEGGMNEKASLDALMHFAPLVDGGAIRASYAPESSKKAPTRREDPILARIAECESSGNLEARNPHSTAKGKYQFLDGSWKYYGEKYWGSLQGKSVFSEKDQDDLARYVVSINGYKDWEASRHCWG